MDRASAIWKKRGLEAMRLAFFFLLVFTLLPFAAPLLSMRGLVVSGSQAPLDEEEEEVATSLETAKIEHASGFTVRPVIRRLAPRNEALPPTTRHAGTIRPRLGLCSRVLDEIRVTRLRN
jgi:hypothetical protein